MSVYVAATDFGDPSVLQLLEETVGPPGPGQVVLDVRAAGVNPVDAKLYSGAMGTDRSRLPMRLGFEAAGVVSAVGPDAESADGPVSVGDEVIGYPIGGAYAEQVVVPASALVAKPAPLSWPEAAGLLLAGTTATHLVAATGVNSNDTVLVHGGAGGVGLMVVQLATAAGARVIATASPSRHDLLRELGAEPVTYGDGLLERVRDLAPDGVDVALDTVGSDEAVDTSLALVADRGRIGSIAAFARGGEGFRLLGNGPGADPGAELRAKARPELARRAGVGDVRVVVAEVFDLAQAAEAHTAILGPHRPGKIVLVP